MTKLRLFTAAFFLMAMFAVSAFAQTSPAATGKIVYINSEGLAGTDEKGTGGITKLFTALTALNNEFKPRQTELQTMQTRFTALQTEIQNLQKTPSSVPTASANLNAKQVELEKMSTEGKRKKEDLDRDIQTRYAVVVGPVMQDVMKSLQDFAKQKGYSMILDASKLAQADVILAIGNDNADVTKEFITYYNTKPAGTAVVK
jgi:Skp family chaperone for outer membrane proteins